MIPSIQIDAKEAFITVHPNEQRQFPLLLKEIATELKLHCTTYGGDWLMILTDPKTGIQRGVCGTKFDLNTVVADRICSDKGFLSDVLTAAGVPCVPHTFFIGPQNLQWAPKAGTFQLLQKYAAKHDFNIVLKLKDGFGGRGVFHCTNQLELEAAALALLKKDYGLVACPHEDVEEEYRIFMINHKPQLVYKKEKPCIIGNGRKNIRALLLDHYLAQLQTHGRESEREIAKNLRSLEKELNLDAVLKNGEKLYLGWKHNLAAGAKPSFAIPQWEKRRLYNLATRTTKAVGVGFATVDIIKVGDGSYKVLEVNSGVTMEKMMVETKGGREIAKKVYKAAVIHMFQTARVR